MFGSMTSTTIKADKAQLKFTWVGLHGGVKQGHIKVILRLQPGQIRSKGV